jgi:hypothetical protein
MNTIPYTDINTALQTDSTDVGSLESGTTPVSRTSDVVDGSKQDGKEDNDQEEVACDEGNLQHLDENQPGLDNLLKTLPIGQNYLERLRLTDFTVYSAVIADGWINGVMEYFAFFKKRKKTLLDSCTFG